jgi:hypothetical protein
MPDTVVVVQDELAARHAVEVERAPLLQPVEREGARVARVEQAGVELVALAVRGTRPATEKGVRSAQKMQVDPCIPVGIQL